MTTNKAVTKLNSDLSHMNKALAAQHKAEASLKTNNANEKKALAKIDAQEKSIIDDFTTSLQSGAPVDPTKLADTMNKLYQLGSSRVKTQDGFDAKEAANQKSIASDKKSASTWKSHGRKDLKPAEYHLGLKATNHDRKELGLGAVKKVIRPPAPKGSKALDVARSHLGKNISYLKYHGSLASDLDKWPANNVCCANFVSACLEKAGQIKKSEHNDNVAGLSANLSHDKNFTRVSANHLSPGDVVCFEVPGEGHFAHTEIFAGYKNGRPTFIGSNNVNSDGTQRITEGYAGYHIDAAYHYKG